MHLLRYLQKRIDPKKYLIKRGATIGQSVTIVPPFYECGEPYLLSIGDNSWVAGEVHFLTHDGATMCANKAGLSVSSNWKYGQINIGKNCFIGTASILFPGIELGDNVIVGAGSVVTKSFPSNCVIGGNPAHILCSLEDYAKKHLFNSIDKKPEKESIRHYLERNKTK